MPDSRVPIPAVAQPPTVFVIDYDQQVRSSVQELLTSVGLPVELFSSAPEFLAAYDPARPGCLILEARLPGLGGLDLQERLARREPASPVIIITAHGDIPMAVRALRNGAVDFLEKPFRPQLLLDRVCEALELDAANRRAHALRGALLARVASLTSREREVMQRVVAGHTNESVAAHLGVTRKAVEAYRARVMRKMQARSLPELVRISIVLTHGVDVLTRGSDCLADARTLPARFRAALFEPHDLVHHAGRPGRAAPAAAEQVKLPGGVPAER
jgi:two-component system response regulator FixJ